MFRVERSDDQGNTWDLLLASPHRIGISDIRGPPEDSKHNYPPSVSPGNKTAFAGRRGSWARVRFDDLVLETFKWERIPENEFDPETNFVWGWQLVHQQHAAIPPERLWPLSFIG